jgi:hypothetical protein
MPELLHSGQQWCGGFGKCVGQSVPRRQWIQVNTFVRRLENSNLPLLEILCGAACAYASASGRAGGDIVTLNMVGLLYCGRKCDGLHIIVYDGGLWNLGNAAASGGTRGWFGTSVVITIRYQYLPRRVRDLHGTSILVLAFVVSNQM